MTQIAIIDPPHLEGLGRATLALVNSLALPDTFALEGDKLAVARMLAPSIADSLNEDDLPVLQGQATDSGYTVRAQLPSAARSHRPHKIVTGLSYSVIHSNSSDTRQSERRSGWAFHSANTRITEAMLASYHPDNAENTYIHPDVAVRGMTWALGQLRRRPLPDGVRWSI